MRAAAQTGAISQPAALALWFVEHLPFGRNQAVAGDLFEELQAGRSRMWFWRQVAILAGLTIWNRLRAFALPVFFSAAWSTLYPLWCGIGRGRLTSALPDRLLGWPYFSVLQLADGIVPAAAFVGLGVLVYLASRAGGLQASSPLRLLRCFSNGISSLLVATIALLYHFKHPVIDLQCIAQAGFYLTFHLFAISIPLAASLSVAILSAKPDRLGLVVDGGATRHS